MASTYLSKNATNNTAPTKATWSFWVKRSSISGVQRMSMAMTSGFAKYHFIRFEDGLLVIANDTGINYVLTQQFRDVSAWYHLVIAIDTTLATSSDRVKVYINGSQVTAFTTATAPTQNSTIFLGETSNAPFVIGSLYGIGYGISSGSVTEYFDGLMANFYFIDGQALTQTSFGETDATTGIWKPKAFSGSYGTNGFFLKFENSGSLGLDSSGNGNNFTVNGTPTQTVDTPSNVFATMNPLCFNLSGYYPSNGTGQSLTNGNLTCAKATQSSYFSTMGVSKGKWYWEVKIDATNSMFGVISINPVGSGDFAYNDQTMNGYYPDADFLILNGVQQANGSGDFDNTPNVTYMFALDATNNKMWYGRNGTWIGNPSAGTSNTFTLPNGYTFAPIFQPCATTQNNNGYINFGNGYFATTAISSPYSDGAGLGKFQYQPPTGYYALCTKNINVYG